MDIHINDMVASYNDNADIDKPIFGVIVSITKNRQGEPRYWIQWCDEYKLMDYPEPHVEHYKKLLKDELED